jgi:hypothetical protein
MQAAGFLAAMGSIERMKRSLSSLFRQPLPLSTFELSAPSRSPFTHRNQPLQTEINRVELEVVNCLVPCQHKGIREFPRRPESTQNGLNPPRGRRFKSCQPDKRKYLIRWYFLEVVRSVRRRSWTQICTAELLDSTWSRGSVISSYSSPPPEVLVHAFCSVLQCAVVSVWVCTCCFDGCVPEDVARDMDRDPRVCEPGCTRVPKVMTAQPRISE